MILRKGICIQYRIVVELRSTHQVVGSSLIDAERLRTSSSPFLVCRKRLSPKKCRHLTPTECARKLHVTYSVWLSFYSEGTTSLVDFLAESLPHPLTLFAVRGGPLWLRRSPHPLSPRTAFCLTALCCPFLPSPRDDLGSAGGGGGVAKTAGRACSAKRRDARAAQSRTPVGRAPRDR